MTAKSLKEEGDVLYKGHNFTGAIEKYTKAISSTSELDPEVYLCYSNRCACYLQLMEFQKAYYDANACVRLKPHWPKGHNRRGSCLVHLQRLDEAYQAYEKALELDSNNIEARNALAKLTQSQNYSNNGSNSSGWNGGPSMLTRLQNKAIELYHRFMAMDWNNIFTSVTAFFTLLYYQANNQWLRLDANTRKYIQIGLVVMLVYYFFFYRSSSGYDYYPSGGGGYYSSGYGYNSGYYGGGGGGLSWTMWGAIMYGAYKVPPMFPDLLGK